MGLVPTLKAILGQLDKAPPPPSMAAAVVTASLSAGASVHKEAFLCGISQLGTYVDADTKNNVWGNHFVNIWFLVSVDQHTEGRVFGSMSEDHK